MSGCGFAPYFLKLLKEREKKMMILNFLNKMYVLLL